MLSYSPTYHLTEGKIVSFCWLKTWHISVFMQMNLEGGFSIVSYKRDTNIDDRALFSPTKQATMLTYQHAILLCAVLLGKDRRRRVNASIPMPLSSSIQSMRERPRLLQLRKLPGTVQCEWREKSHRRKWQGILLSCKSDTLVRFSHCMFHSDS